MTSVPRPSARRVPIARVLSSLVLLALVVAVAPRLLADDPVAPPAAGAGSVRVVAWNDLGMHCLDPDFSVFSLLPPFNTIQAQVMVDGQLLTSPGAYAVTYRAIADASGSIDTSSIGKTNFWDHAGDLFGANLAPDHGLFGADMPGPDNVPQPMLWDDGFAGYIARGIPLTPYDDAGLKNTYPMMRIEVRDGTSALVATSDIVLPVSDEMACNACHASGASDAAKPAAGWSDDPDALRAERLNILRLHDEKNADDPLYAPGLAANGLSSDGLYASVVVDGHAVLCAGCHLSNALPGSGIDGLLPLTEALHARHAGVDDPQSGLPLDDAGNRSACYRCHPGSSTRCLRGAMGAAVASDGSLAMQCQSCHGSMSQVGMTGRVGWLDEPGCGSCHTGTATHNSGQIRYTSVFDVPGHRRVPADDLFATNPDAPSPGFSLYRFSSGHGGLQCEACHGSTHAIFPSSHASDNVASVEAQGHVGELSDCTTCHASSPATNTGGPHGMHPVGQPWVSKHQGVAEHSTSNCRTCHGADLRGTVLSRALGERSLSTGYGTKTLWRGATVSCWLCHDGPGSEGKSKDKPPVVQGAQVEVDQLVPTSFALDASDANGDALVLRVVTQPAHGTVGVTAKTATYFPDGDWLGPDAFTFAAWDGKIDSNLATVALGVIDAACPTALSASSATFGAAGGAGDVTLTIPLDCAWTVVLADPLVSWLTLTSPVEGTGSEFVTFDVAPNLGASARSTTLFVGGKPFVVQQAGTTGPDLAGEWTKLLQHCKTKTTTRCRLSGRLLVTNLGDQVAAKTYVRFYLSDDEQFDVGDTLVKERKVKTLKPGKSSTRKLKVKLPVDTTASGRFVLAVLDADGILTEIDESNDVVASMQIP
ncbi:MAG: hypothetical protein H6825_08530 [Planctomycetes bacterium]|nr:hypothetical protein [Planctomycetota bacterium]